jgi:cytochrome c-type biogenesis protein CcmF
VYVTLAASDGRGGVTIQAIVNPLVSWIWTGGVILTIGAIIGLVPRLIPVAVVTVETDTPRHETRKARLGAHA